MSLTFGIELEYVFAFDLNPRVGFEWMGTDGMTDKDLFGHDDTGSGDDFALSSDQESESSMDWESSEPSEKTEEHNDDDDVHHRRVVVVSRTDRGRSNRHQNARIGLPSATMFLTQSILENSGLECTVGERGYGSWNIQVDGSIDEPEKLSKYIPDRLDAEDEGDWVVSGQELVSRVLTAPYEFLSFDVFRSSDALREISSYLEALHGKPKDPFGVFVNESCGFHVHVARKPPPRQDSSSSSSGMDHSDDDDDDDDDDDEMIPLPILQHLAYLLVQFEELINVLHHESRRCRSDWDSHYVQTNLMGIRRSSHWCRHNVESVDLIKAQKKIFHKDMTPSGLAKLMDATLRPKLDGSGNLVLETRYKFVNFEPLTYQGGAKTIEFRQHIGTMDFDEIAHWTHFTLCLVRTAERMALCGGDQQFGVNDSPCSPSSSSPDHLPVSFRKKQANKYRLRCAKLQDEFERMYDLLEFDEDVRGYWRKRFVRLNPAEGFRVGKDQNGVEYILDEEDRCPSCM
ncbi:hypothetical protein LTS17_012147 [Exophiala oligosperma]